MRNKDNVYGISKNGFSRLAQDSPDLEDSDLEEPEQEPLDLEDSLEALYIELTEAVEKLRKQINTSPYARSYYRAADAAEDVASIATDFKALLDSQI